MDQWRFCTKISIVHFDINSPFPKHKSFFLAQGTVTHKTHTHLTRHITLRHPPFICLLLQLYYKMADRRLNPCHDRLVLICCDTVSLLYHFCIHYVLHTKHITSDKLHMLWHTHLSNYLYAAHILEWDESNFLLLLVAEAEMNGYVLSRHVCCTCII